MSENVIIAIIGAIGTLTGGIVGTIGSVLIARINKLSQQPNMSLPPSSGSSKIKIALITAVVGLASGLLISFWIFSGKISHSQENAVATPAISDSETTSAHKSANIQNSTLELESVSPKKTASVTPTPTASAPAESIKKKEPAPKEEKGKPKAEPKKAEPKEEKKKK